jgi:hypothetical protein
MSGNGRFRWLTYPEWERSPRSLEMRVLIGGVEFIASLALVYGVRHEWWGCLPVVAVLLGDYVVWSVVAYRREGPVVRPRPPARLLSCREWAQRQKQRRGLHVIALVLLVSASSTAGMGSGAVLLAFPLLWGLDFAWCCVSPDPRPVPPPFQPPGSLSPTHPR